MRCSITGTFRVSVPFYHCTQLRLTQRIRGLLNGMRYINPRFTYLLTYLLIYLQIEYLD